MIVYSQMTLQEAVDEVLLRCSQHRTAVNLDFQTVALLVSRSIREVVSTTLPFKEWAYISSIPINFNAGAAPSAGAADEIILNSNAAAGAILPINYIAKVRLTVEYFLWNGTQYVSATNGPVEARYVDPKEWFTLTDWQRGQTWNRGTVHNPVYTIWGQKLPNTGGLATDYDVTGAIPVQTPPTLFLAPNHDHTYLDPGVTPAPASNALASNPPTGLLYPLPTTTGNNGNDHYWVNAVFDCILMPPDLTNPFDILRVPYEYENLVINLATSRALAKVNANDILPVYGKKIMEERMKLRQEFIEKRTTEKEELESFQDYYSFVEPEKIISPK